MEFKTSLFGYRKSTVREYIKTLTQSHNITYTEQQERLNELRQEIKRLQQSIHEYENKENQIAQALIEARQRAESILNETEREIQQKKKDSYREIESIMQKREKLNEHLVKSIEQALLCYQLFGATLEAVKNSMEEE